MAASSASAALVPRVVDTVWPTADVVIASLVVQPPIDPNADAAPLIQAAIDEAADGGGAVVFLPVGAYRLASPLVLREGVTLRGDWAPPGTAPAAQTTRLLLVHGRGDADAAPAITIEKGTGLRELTLWHPEQSGTEPVPYPWAVAISTTNAGNNFTLANMTLVNPWRGASFGPQFNELHTLRNIYGTPLNLGVFIDTVTDIGRLDNVDFSPSWWAGSGLPGAPTAAALAPTLGAATGVDMGRSDWEYIYQVRVRGYGTGMVIRAGAQGTTNAVMFGCELLDCGTALRVEALNGVGLAATACELTGTTGLATTGAFTTIAQFNSCQISSVDHPSRGVLTFQHCDLGPVSVTGDGTFSALDCDLGPVHLGPEVGRARVLGCRWAGAPQIRNESQGDVAIVHRDLALTRPDVTPHVPAPVYRPANDLLFVVTAYGAAEAADDNTAAFQAALDAAEERGGGTVYVPAGRWQIRGGLRVPTGVELRGIFDVPHHTVSDGSTLLAFGGAGDAQGTPLISLEAGSGARGLTVWYPEQNVLQPVEFPWSVQSLGPGCWVRDVALGNPWQGVDFATHPSTGHVINYLAGAPVSRGLQVSKSDGDGWVEDVQFNPHYTMRIPGDFPRPDYGRDTGGDLILWQRANMVAMAVGDCEREHMRGNFVYAAHDGLAFVRDGGTANARVFMHGSDTVSRPAVLDGGNVEAHLTQLVPLSAQEVAAFVTTPAFDGQVAFHNSQVWAGTKTAQFEGSGRVLLSQFNTLTGPVRAAGGQLDLIGGFFSGSWQPAVALEPPTERARVVATLSPGALEVANGLGDAARVVANSADSPRGLGGSAAASLDPDAFHLQTGWEAGEAAALSDTVATTGGGIREVPVFTARAEPGTGREGGTGVRLTGRGASAHPYVYALLAQTQLGVRADTELKYWFKPENARGLDAFVDLYFTDGTTLRDSAAVTTGGAPARHPARAAAVGEWLQVTVPLGGVHFGKVIQQIMFAWDSTGGPGEFAATIDDLVITSDPVAVAAPEVSLAGRTLTLRAPAGWQVAWSTNGTNPSEDSPRGSVATVTAPANALGEIRWRLIPPGGQMLRAVGSRVW